MSVNVANYIHACCSVTAAGAFTANDGFASIANPSPGVYNLTLQAGIDSTKVQLSANPRGGFPGGARWVSDSVIQVLTFDPTLGPTNVPFDLEVRRTPISGNVAPPADPAAVWSGAAGGGFGPPVYVVTPTVPTPPGQYDSITDAIAAAVADGYGNAGPPALVLVFPGTYTESVALVNGIHVSSLQAAVGPGIGATLSLGPSRLVGAAGAQAVAYTPLAGGDVGNRFVKWEGVDIDGGAGQTAVSLLGANPGALYVKGCSVTGQNVGVLGNNSAGVIASLLQFEDCLIRSPAGGAAVLAFAAQTVRLINCAVEGTSLDADGLRVEGGSLLSARNIQVGGRCMVNAGAAILQDAFISANLLSAIDVSAGATCQHLSGRANNAAAPTISGLGTYTSGLVTFPGGPGAIAVTTHNQLSIIIDTAPAPWVAPAPKDLIEAINRLAAQLQVVGAAPIP